MNPSKRPLTILQFGISYAPRWQDGGPPRIMYDYARHLIGEEFRVMVLTGDNSRPGAKDNWAGFPPELEVHYCHKLGDWRRHYYFDYSWSELTRFFDTHWEEIDFVHLYQTRSLFNVVALWAARKYGLRIILSSFGSMPRRGSLFKFIYDHFFVLPLNRRAALLLAQTSNECEVYREYGGGWDQIRLLPLAVDLGTRAPVTERSKVDFRERYGISQAACLFLFVGRIHPTKGVEFLVNCFAEVVKAAPGAHLAIVGHDGGSQAAVEEVIRTRGLAAKITLCGPIFDTARWPAYAAADCFAITPEIHEETSLASLEALACGTPVVTNHRADVPWLDAYGAGKVVPGGDGAATVAALLDICQATPAARLIQRQAAERLAAEKFEIGSVTRQFAALLAQTARVPARKTGQGPLLIGPLPGAVETSGQAVCFKLLVDGLTARGLAGPIVNLVSAGSQAGKPTFRRAKEYISILGKVTWHCWTNNAPVYLTIAQSRHGFIRDGAIIALAKFSGNEVILHLNGGNYANYYNSERRLIQALIRLVLRRARAIIVLADNLRDCFSFDPALSDRLHVVQNSFPAEGMPAVRPKRSIQPTGEITLLYLSNLIESKGYLEVLDVLHHLQEKENLSARAVFCGTFLAHPSDDIRIRNRDHARHLFAQRIRELGLREFVTYRGSVSGTEKDRVLRESSFLVFPTRYDNEGQPVVLIEALAYGLPALTTNYRANGEMIIDGVTGILTAWQDTAGMAQKIAELWSDPLAYEEMSVRCRSHFEARFTPKAHIDAMQRVLFRETG